MAKSIAKRVLYLPALLFVQARIFLLNYEDR